MLATAAEARLTNFTVGKVTSPQFNGQTFGNVGAYEELRGTFSGEIDPLGPALEVMFRLAGFPTRNVTVFGR